MRRYISKSVSFDPELFTRMEAWLDSLCPRVNRSQYIEKLIREDLARMDKSGVTGFTINPTAPKKKRS